MPGVMVQATPFHPGYGARQTVRKTVPLAADEPWGGCPSVSRPASAPARISPNLDEIPTMADTASVELGHVRRRK